MNPRVIIRIVVLVLKLLFWAFVITLSIRGWDAINREGFFKKDTSK